MSLPAELASILHRAASGDETVLLTGETGSGKSLVARLIHDASPRSSGPFIAVNCAALPEGLFERELYGHVAGAFTDARESHPGYFEAAAGGTILLDEIGELSLTAQAKLLMTAETGVVHRLGSPRPVPANVRLIAATNADLRTRVTRGTFRSDLYFRLATIPIALPPLRKRTDELPKLVESLLNRLAPHCVPQISDEVWVLLASHTWPGNIRELESVLRHALQFGRPIITSDCVPRELVDGPARRRFRSRGDDPDLEWQQILGALRRCSGNRTHAAHLLGMSRSTLWSKIRLHRLAEIAEKESGQPIAEASRRLDWKTSHAITRRSKGQKRSSRSALPVGLADSPIGRVPPISSTHRIRPDIRDTLRLFRARPGETLARVVLLAAAIGLVTGIFALSDPFLLKPLPYPDADRLVAITVRTSPGGLAQNAVAPTISDWRRRIGQFADVAAYQGSEAQRFEISSGDAVVRTAKVTQRFLYLLGTQNEPAPVDPSSPDLVPLILKADVFNRIFPATPPAAILGQTFLRPPNGRVRIDGVLPPGFVFSSRNALFPVEALIPVADHEIKVTVAASGLIVGRLAAGVAEPQLESALWATFEEPAFWQVEVTSLDAHLKSSGRRLALVAMVAGVLIAFVCAGNLANLRLASRVNRAREFATRRAVGASDVDLIRLVLFELVTEALIGLGAGLGIAVTLVTCLQWQSPAEFQLLGSPSIDGRAVFCGCLTGLMIVLASAAPTWSIKWGSLTVGERTDLADGRRVRRIRFLAITAQSAFASLLFLGASLLLVSWATLIRQDAGFETDALVLSVSYRPGHGGPALDRDIEATLERLRRLPGVEAAGAAVGSMLDRLVFPASVTIRGRSVSPVAWKQVTPGYFEAAGSRLLTGRFLRDSDRNQSPLVMTEGVTRRAGTGLEVIGDRADPGQREVVGVIRDERNRTLDDDPMPTVFTLMHEPWGRCARHPCGQVSYVVGGLDSSLDLRRLAEKAIVSVNREAIVFEASSIAERLSGTVRDRTFATLVLGIFGAAAVTIALIGLVAVVIFTVRQRTREIGIRIAIGAQPADILYVVLAETVGAAVLGLVLGFLVSRVGARTIDHLMYGLETHDWVTSTLALLLLLSSAVIAALIPARRALQISPTTALRVE